MRCLKYHDQLSCTSIAAGGTLGCFIPPSGNLMVYGIMASQSISKLLIAGIVPGLILIGFYIVVIKSTAAATPRRVPPRKSSAARRSGRRSCAAAR